MPEFGEWMLEAVPSSPYGAYSDPEQLLSCYDKITTRRKFLQTHLKQYGDGNLRIASTASPIILGTHESMTSNNPETRAKIDKAYAEGLQKTNPCTKSLFVPEFTASPHPRFLGLAQSIRERREEKVKILSPIYKDVNTSFQAT